MQVRSVVSGGSGSLNSRYHFSSNDKAAKIAAIGFTDEFLNQEVCIQAFHGIDDPFCGLVCFSQNHSLPLSTHQKLHNQGSSTYHVNQLFRVQGRVGEPRKRHAQAIANKQLRSE